MMYNDTSHLVGRDTDTVLVDSLDHDFRVHRLLIWVVNPGKSFDHSLPSELVQAFRVALLANFERNIHKNFDEIPCGHKLAHYISIPLVRGDEAHNGDQSSVSEKSRCLSHSPDVLPSIFSRKPQVFTKSLADLITIQHITDLRHGI
ncbi:hypothetical protein Mapa_006920 [Marchantia paleacea]|nr:hypothetical protein Mapa_006920 [Marchantia paleacea]